MSISGDSLQDGRGGSSIQDQLSESEQIAVIALCSLSGTSLNSTPISPLTSPPTVSPMPNNNILKILMRGSPPHPSKISGSLPINTCTNSNFSSTNTSVGYHSHLFYHPTSSIIQVPTGSSFVNANIINSHMLVSPVPMHASSHFNGSKVRSNYYYTLIISRWIN